MKTFFAFIGVLALIVFGLIVLSVPGTTHSPSTQNAITDRATATPVAQTEQRALPVEAERLFLDYQRNEVAADHQYRGRRLLVTGMVTSVKKDFTDKVYVVLGTSNMFMGVDASLKPSEVARAGELSKGEEITVLCRGGMMILGSPMLDDCVFGNAPVESEAPAPTYAPQPSNERQPATVPVINAANIAPVTATAPVSRQNVGQSTGDTMTAEEFNSRFGWYVDVIKRKVAQNWYLREVDTSTPAGGTVYVQFTVAQDGTPGNLAIATASSSPSLNLSCMQAVRRVDTFGPLPAGYDKTSLAVLYHCTYPGPNVASESSY
jgi:TonB family protein